MRRYIYNIYEKQQSKNNVVSCVLLYSKPQYRAKHLGPRCLEEKGGRTLLERQVHEAKSAFKEREIIVCTGIGLNKIMKEKTVDFRIVDNSAYETTGTVEEVKLGLLNSCSSTCIFINDETFVSKADLLKLSKESALVVDSKNSSETKIVTENGIPRVIGFNGQLSFKGCFSLTGHELALAYEFIYREYSKSKLDIEMLNYILDHGGKFSLLEQ